MIQELLKDLTSKLERLRDAGDRAECVRRAVVGATGLVLCFAFVVSAESLISFGPVARTILLFLFLLAAAVPAVVYVARPLARLYGLTERESLLLIALRVGVVFPAIKDRLANAIEMGPETAADRWVSSELVEESLRTIHAEISSLDLLQTIDTSGIVTARKNAGMAFATVVLLTVLFPAGLSNGLYRLWHFEQDFTPPKKYVLTVTPGTAQVAKGSDVVIIASVRTPEGSLAADVDEVILTLRPVGQERSDPVTMRRSDDGSFAHTLASLGLTTAYQIHVREERSEVFVITVLDWPALQSLRVRLEYPRYARLPVSLQEDFSGEITALAGTRVSLSGLSTKLLTSGFLLFGDSTTSNIDVNGTSFSSTFRVLKPGTYSVHVTDTEGLTNRSPVTYDIRVVPDAFPIVTVVEPGRSLDIAGHEPVGLLVRMSDDFGFSGARLRYRLSHSRYERPSETFSTSDLPLSPSAGSEVDVSYLWDLAPLSLVPEDVVEYYVEAFDNDDVGGPKRAESERYTLRLPSLEEVFTDLDGEHELRVEDLGKSLEEAKELKKELEKIDQDLKTNKSFDWQKQQEVKDLSEKVEKVQKQLQETQRQLSEMTEQMQKQQVLSPETLEKYLELQELFKELDADELQKALKDLQKSMEGPRREQIDEALKKVEFSEERFRVGIERTINLLKRIHIEQKMDEARRRSEEVADAQKELAEQGSGDERTQAKRQEELAEQQKGLEETLGDLQQKMEEFFTEMPADRLAEMNKSLAEKDLQNRMNAAAQKMRQGNKQQAQQMQQGLQQDLQELAEQLTSMQQELLNQQMERTLNALRRATTDLLELSRRQEGVKNDAQTAPPNSPALRQNAQDQMRLMQDLNNVATQLSELSQRSFAVTPEMGRALGEALNSMQNAMRDLDVRNGARASQDQAGAMASLNKAAQEVQKSLQAMMEGSQGSPGGMGLMQQLQMMAGQQMMLNAQTQRLGNDMGEGEEMRRAAEAARIAKEQDAVRKSLEQLQREAKESGEQQRILGDLDRIAQEMREVVKELEQNNADTETVRRQEQILSRLLDASRSMRERDFEKRRRSTTGRDVQRESPGELDADGRRAFLRQELLRALEKGYARDYQDLIRRYFEELEKVERETLVQ